LFDPDPVIEAYKPGIDRTLLLENLKLSPNQRCLNLQAHLRFAAEVQRAGASARKKKALNR
ncbi:MAG: hypothetical protein K1X64_22225, partial [Myxococcaceae bacterium]|nr:hypothetical protein [Myxococcaceae bacterium]